MAETDVEAEILTAEEGERREKPLTSRQVDDVLRTIRRCPVMRSTTTRPPPTTKW
jgi:hypothetical protein